MCFDCESGYIPLMGKCQMKSLKNCSEYDPNPEN